MNQSYYKFVLIFLSTLFCSSLQDCKLRYATDFADKESVLLWPTIAGYDLVQPENDGIVLKANQKIGLACPGTRNKFTKIDSNLIVGTCVKDQTLKIGTKSYLLNELGCNVKVTGEYEPSTDRCGNTGIIKHIGYNINDEFDILIDVCYDDKQGGALYAEHVLYGTAVDYAGSSIYRPGFKVPGLSPGVSSDDFEQKNQKSTFERILGDKTLADKYFSSSSYLAKGHLAPDADMVFVSSQLTTYFYINTVPQWQQINNGNWKSLEGSIRKLASNLQENFLIYTGSHDVLTLPDINRKQQKMYLSNGKLPVPKFVWKVIHSYETNKGIAFVSVNNPFIDRTSSDLFLCKDICKDYSWGTSNWNNLNKGLVYCCEIDDLRRKVPIIPKLKVSSVQEGNAKKFRTLSELFEIYNL